MGDDIHGDGINVVDRIQALAEPGGIAISGMAYDHVRVKVAVGFASLGEQTVKSNAGPIRVYRVVLDPAAAGKTTEAGKNRRSWRVPAAAAAVVIVLLLGELSRGGNRGERRVICLMCGMLLWETQGRRWSCCRLTT